MKIHDEVRKTVGFIGYENKKNGEFTPVGSVFFFGHDPTDGGNKSSKMYAVTARHVIDGLQKKGVSDVVLRLNSKQKASFVVVTVPIGDWFVHPKDASIDVAIKEMGIPDQADHLVIPKSMSATKEKFVEHEIELGEEVFISGMFRHHVGTKRNIPIVRVGSLAALNEEKIETDDFGEMDGYLIEARSTGGLSGSPVFLNLGIVRKIKGETKFATGNHSLTLLLGLVHGHYDVPDPTAGIETSINAGIAIVVPIHSIIAVIDEYEKGAASGKAV